MMSGSADGLTDGLADCLGLTETRYGGMLYFANDPYMAPCLQKYGEWSELEADVFRQFVRPGDTVVEGGANIGAHSLMLARQVGNGRLIVVEPQPAVFRVLTANLALNGHRRVQAVNAGLGERDGMLYVPAIDYAQPVNVGGVALSMDGGAPVRVVTIDSMELPAVRLIKLDVEGMEINALRGAERTVRRCRPVLYLESDRRDKEPALAAFIRSLGYRLWRHSPPYYNAGNWRGERENVFPGYVSRNVLALPAEWSVTMTGGEEIMPD